MVYSIGVQNKGITSQNQHVAFGQKEKKSDNDEHDKLLIEERRKHPVSTAVKIQGDKLVKAFTEYPKKGFQGSKNANFYEFLTMGIVPYLTGSVMLMAVFNFARKFFNTSDNVAAAKLGNKMSLGVLAYGVMKTLSKKLIEVPVNLRYGIDVNLPYKKRINELPEESNKDNLVKFESHKVFESVDFPRWDLLYENEAFGDERNSYFKKVSKRFGYKENDLDYSDQKMKSKIKETVVKTRLFTTLSSYFWAATGVGIAMQKPWENLKFSPIQRLKDFKNYKAIEKTAKEQGRKIAQYDYFYKDFGKKLVESCKEFVNNKNTAAKYAGRILLGTAVGMTILGNFFALHDFNKDKGSKTQASTSLIDDSKEKVIC